MAKKFKRDPEEGFGDKYMSDADLEKLMGFREPSRPSRAEAPAPRRQGASAPQDVPTRVSGVIIENRGSELLVELGSKSHGVIAREEFGDDPVPPVGTLITAELVRYDRQNDLAVLSVRGVRHEILWDELKEGMILEGTVSEVNRGGLVLTFKGIRAFMPISQIERERVEDASAYVGRKLRCAVTSVDRAARNLVVSRRVLLDQEAAETRAKALESLIEGQVVVGTVTRLTEFGAFIDLGGVDGLLHQSKIKDHAREIGQESPLAVGQKIEVEIGKIDAARGRIALDFRRRPAAARNRALEGYTVGETVTGWVEDISDEGAIVAFEDGAKGLIPREVLSEDVKLGSVVKATISAVDAVAGRIEIRPLA